MALAVGDEVVDEEDGDEQDGDLEGVEAQGHLVHAHAPADDDEQWDDEKGDLHAGANSDANGQIHLVLDGDGDGGGVLGGVADDREQDQADELGADGPALRDGTDAVDHELGADGDDGSGDGQGGDGDEEVELRLLAFVVFRHVGDPIMHPLVVSSTRREAMAAHDSGGGDESLSDSALLEVAVPEGLCLDFLAFLGEDHGVGFELEKEVGGVDEKQDDGGAAGELGDVGLGCGAGDVKNGGDNDSGHGEGEETGGRLGNGGVEVLLLTAQAAEKEAHAHDEQQVGEDTADEGGLDNDNLLVNQRNDGNNELDGVTS